ncbi:NADP-dependent oxidoreductase [Deinococcus peraridilitoris]|uniref:Zn-dependent oxidoreductase, NADPH:quinone reductase n=1 Tax=Deinococcus peraridilitoris (strain DSM 19664 / LMG 22246 / CIP 109416 / KR-200) TaxID=937777 RepID=L0A6X7_DEIPD|nr:NADP-dependent oxidoreductase [Deinococcus peraridilitoris]AFZ69194.1 Zn-dependent oxidoreductase, NADPH:quinone reductase [Deinococcus peraridilitoris DSM 19664]
MRAVRFHTFGDPSVLRLEETNWPYPKRDEVLIHVHASSVNGTDLGIRGGSGPFKLVTCLPFTPGFDVAGEVARCGPDVTAFNVGDRVYALLGHGGGGAAEYVTVRQSRVALVPQRIPLAHAAAVPLAGLSALQALRRGAALHLRPGAHVLIVGASGGIGSFAVQIAKYYGAHVTGAARPEKHPFVRSLGAHETIDTRSLAESGVEGRWDVIFDTAPILTLSAARPHLTPSGTLVSVRAFPAEVAEVTALVTPGGPHFHGMQTRERGLDLALLSRWIDAGHLHVPIDHAFPLEQVADAHRYLEGSDVRGKVLLTTG